MSLSSTTPHPLSTVSRLRGFGAGASLTSLLLHTAPRLRHAVVRSGALFRQAASSGRPPPVSSGRPPPRGRGLPRKPLRPAVRGRRERAAGRHQRVGGQGARHRGALARGKGRFFFPRNPTLRL